MSSPNKTEEHTHMKARRSVTLIEIIIVMILIATITGALAVSYQGSLEKGRAFKTEQSMRKIDAILNIYFAEHPEAIAEASQCDWQAVVLDSPLSGHNDTSIVRDGWGAPFQVQISNDTSGISISVASAAYNAYKKKHKHS